MIELLRWDVPRRDGVDRRGSAWIAEARSGVARRGIHNAALPAREGAQLPDRRDDAREHERNARRGH